MKGIFLNMSQRHYIKIYKNNVLIFSEQILGNNDFFDEEFYNNLNIKIEDDYFDLVEIEFANFLKEWHEYLERHPEMKGIPKIPEQVKERFDDAEYKEYLYIHYLTAESYEMQVFRVVAAMSEYCNYRGELDKRYVVMLGCY